MKLYNTHVHLFTASFVPSGFYGRPAKNFFNKIKWLVPVREFFLNLLKFINPFNAYDKGNQLAKLVEIGALDSQQEVLENLRGDYDFNPNMNYVVLSLDMDYMEAGTPDINYLTQLEELTQLKYDNQHDIIPFVCIDPRRFEGELLVKFVKEYIEDKGFKGIKMYPALGYYPFDARLLDLYAYAEKNQIPIITHCDRGGIHYQGTYNPISKSKLINDLFYTRYYYDFKLIRRLKNEIAKEKSDFEFNLEDYEQFRLSQTFTKLESVKSDGIDPMKVNQFVIQAEDDFNNVKKYFDTKDISKFTSEPRFFHNFSHPQAFEEILKIFPKLKICFAHFGGSEEIQKVKKVKSNLSQLFKSESSNRNGCHIDLVSCDSFIKCLRQTKTVSNSWYLLILDLMSTYENVYADISYSLHDKRNFPLLNAPLQVSHIADRILFGTDFYLVEREKSEKKLVNDYKRSLANNHVFEVKNRNYYKNRLFSKPDLNTSEETLLNDRWLKISSFNPGQFLNNNLGR
ncbi:MAG: amidohydrolase family protein [Bacteroidota bacterium]